MTYEHNIETCECQACTQGRLMQRMSDAIEELRLKLSEMTKERDDLRARLDTLQNAVHDQADQRNKYNKEDF